MNNQPEDPQASYEAAKPVAYDAEGRPLYAHPPQSAPQTNTRGHTVVHVARPFEPAKPVVSAKRQRLHEESARLYPFLNLSTGEYVIRAVRRHPIGLILPLGAGTLAIGVLFSLLLNYDLLLTNAAIASILSNMAVVTSVILALIALIGLGMFIAYYVYVNNKFFLTNESVIQEIQVSLFARHEQTVSLASIEDASYTQVGILQHIFDYGDIRLSTEGDETTYRFSYVATPKAHIAQLNNAVEAFKNGRPVEAD